MGVPGATAHLRILMRMRIIEAHTGLRNDVLLLVHLPAMSSGMCLQRPQVIHALLNALDWMRRMILLDMAV